MCACVPAGFGNTLLTLVGKSFTLQAVNPSPGGTVIDCKGVPACSAFLASEKEPASTVVRGFTIRNGRITQNHPWSDLLPLFCPFPARGPGIVVSSSSATFEDCVVENGLNTALGGQSGGYGGGVAVFSADPERWVSAPTFRRCTVRNNSALSGGGASVRGKAYALFTQSSVTGNEALMGGGFFVSGDFHAASPLGRRPVAAAVGKYADELSPLQFSGAHIDRCLIARNAATYSTSGFSRSGYGEPRTTACRACSPS